MAEKMTALDDKEWTSSEEDNSASSSEDELHETFSMDDYPMGTNAVVVRQPSDNGSRAVSHCSGAVYYFTWHCPGILRQCLTSKTLGH